MQVGLQLIIIVSISEPVWSIVLNWTLCPDRSQWDLRAASFCNTSAPSYACLFDANDIVYKEFCMKKSEIQRPGYQFVIRGALDDKKCDRNRYQPFKLTTKGQSQCIFKKSKCTEEGQIEYHNGTTTSDRLCRCDYTNFYSFSKKYGDPCFCNPSEEDCSCYKTNCPEGYVLSTDNTCIEWERLTESYHCPEIKSKEIPNDVPIKEKAPLETDSPGAASSSNLIGWIIFYCLPSVTCVLFVVVYFCGWKETIPNDEPRISKLLEQIHDIVPPDELQIYNLPKNVDEIRLSQIGDWKKEDKLMHVTVAMQDVTELLENNKCVTVIGPTASGKSTLIRHIALLWQKKDYRVIPIISKQHKDKPLELLKCYSLDSQKKIFVIDDLCGVDNVDVVAVDVWISQLDNLIKLISSKNEIQNSVKILMSCRVSIFKSDQFKGLAFMTGHEYKIHENPSSLEEKKSILERHTNKEDVEKVSHLLEKCTNYFPLFCKIAANKTIDNQKELFILQNELIERDITDMPDEEFISVFVCVLFEEFKDEWIDIQSRPEEVNTAMKCLLEKCVHLNSKDEALQTLPIKTGAYVKKSRNGYSLVHRVISDIVFVKCDERAEDVFLWHASFSFIATRYRFMSINQNLKYMETAISNKKQYFERLKRDLQNGDLDSIIHNKQLKHPTFRTKLINYITKNNEMNTILKNLQTDRNLLIETAMEGYNDLIGMLIDIRGTEDVNVTDSRGRSALHIAVEKRYKDIACSLLGHGANIDEDNQGRTPFKIAQSTENVDMTKTMMKLNQSQ